MRRPVIVVGAGGHGKVVADALISAGEHVLGFVDPDSRLHGRTFCGVSVLGADDLLTTYDSASVLLANGIGGVGIPVSDVRRAQVQATLTGKGWQFSAVRHPTAIVSSFANLDSNVQILAGAIVQAYATIGAGVVINTGAIVEHESFIGERSHIAPRAVVCGDVVIGSYCHIGAGAVVRQGVHIGDHTVLAAGAVAIRNFGGRGVLLGVPARSVGADPR